MKRKLLSVGGGALLAGGILGAALFFLIRWGWLGNPVVYLRGHLAAVLLWGGLGLLILFVGHVIFISRRQARQAEDYENLRTAYQQNRRRFLQRLDHELKNPLTVIRAGMANISSETLSDYLTKEVSAVQAQVLRISQLVADLRKVATLEEKAPDLTTVNLAELLEETVEIVRDRSSLDGRKLTLIIPNAPWPLPQIEADPDLLLLAVHNLIENALKYTHPGDTVEVRAHEEGSYVVIEVADTGRGIPAEEQNRVWEELYRGTQSHGVPGSGLGLSLVKAIAEKHNGKVILRSKPEQGSVFGLYLPMS